MVRRFELKIAVFAILCIVSSASCPAADDATPKPRSHPRISFGPGLELLRAKNVQKELALSDQQLDLVQKLDKAETDKSRELQRSLRTHSDVDKQARLEEWRKVVKDGIGRILDRQQLARFKELQIQFNGTVILTEPEIAEALRLNDEQSKQLHALSDSYGRRQDETLRSMRGIDPERASEKLATFDENFSKMMLEVLTPRQRERFNEMKGKDFEFDVRH